MRLRYNSAMQFKELVAILQAAVGPAILISSVGLLLLSMTNRFARVVDRSRQLAESARKLPADERQRFESQLEILLRRARLLRAAITVAVVSVLLAALLVIALFVSALLDINVVVPCGILFSACLLCLIVSLTLFLRDLHLSLTALKLDVQARE
jgi:hypothetical protein